MLVCWTHNVDSFTSYTEPSFTVLVDESVGKRPFTKLLEGAVFVLSGFKNPFRGELRQKGVEMGGVYLADWDESCTHLM